MSYSYNITDSKILDLVVSVIENISTDDNNISIRFEGANYFINFVNENSPILGCGIFSEINYPNNPITIPGEIFNYYQVDINGISTYIQFGILGLIYLLFKTFRDTQLIDNSGGYKTKKLAMLFFYILFYVLVTPTLNNILVQNKLLYTGVILYFLGGYYKNKFEAKPNE